MTRLGEDDWDRLLQRIEDDRVTPFLGAGASSAVLPTGRTVAATWAKKFNYPLDDRLELARVAQFLAIVHDAAWPKEELVRDILAAGSPSYLSLIHISEPTRPY